MSPPLARADDVALAQRLVREAVPDISSGYAELVTNLGADEGLRGLVASAHAERATASSPLDRARIQEVLFGQILSSAFIGTYRKAHAQLVSRGEREAGARIRRLLEEERPRDGFKGEETGSRDGQSGRWWLDDPVDGTASMLKTAVGEAFGLDLPDPKPRFAVTVALVEEGVPTVGVVGELRPTKPPLVGLEVVSLFTGYLATQGYRTETEGQAMVRDPSGVLFVTAPEVMFRDPRGERDPAKERGVEALLAWLGLSAPITGQNILGLLACADEHSLALEGDLTAEDVAAAIPILGGSGIEVSDPSGNELRFADLDAEFRVLVAARSLAPKAVARLAEAARGNGPTPYFDLLFRAPITTGNAQKFASQG
jgi:fructose-1,6-bisphosphatase/inositol monophosphatase family enzyme